MRILVLGATGMLGYQVFKTCLERNISVQTVVRNKQLLLKRLGIADSNAVTSIDDIKNIDRVEEVVAGFRPDYIINCIGIVKQSQLAENCYESVAINSFLPHQLEKLGRQYNCKLIHISTDCVFDGKAGLYKESDFSNAWDLYGRSKFLGEVNYGCGITIRTSIIGHEITKEKHGLIDWFLNQPGTVKGYTKAIFSGLTTVELTKVILDVIIAGNIDAGLYNVASQPVAKYELLKLVAEVYKKKTDIVPSEEVVIDRSLDPSKFRELTSYRCPSWPEMIKAMHTDYLLNFKDRS